VARLIFLLASFQQLCALRPVAFGLPPLNFALALCPARPVTVRFIAFQLIAHPPGTAMAWSFAFNFAAEHTVKFAAPSQLIRKVLKTFAIPCGAANLSIGLI
jgi:hypothetical protein